MNSLISSLEPKVMLCQWQIQKTLIVVVSPCVVSMNGTLRYIPVHTYRLYKYVSFVVEKAGWSTN